MTDTHFQKGQKVLTPNGSGLIEEIISDDITVKLDDGDTKTYKADDLQDDSSAG